MKRLLISSIIFSIVMVTADACAPVPIMTSTPTQTPSPIPTQSPTITPTETPVEFPAPSTERVAVGPNQELLISEKDLAPFDKRLMINPELEAEFAEKVFTICNQYTFLSEMANEIQSRRNSSPLPDPIYQSFDDYMKLKIQPAIDKGETIKAFHLVGHETRANKSPYIGMVKFLGEVDPSKCNVIFGKPSKSYPSSIKIDLGVYQIGMNIIEQDGKSIRQLIISPGNSKKNQYNMFYVNEKTTLDDNALAYSQLVNVLYEYSDQITHMIPKGNNAEYKGQFVLGRSGANGEDEASINFALPGSGGVEAFEEWMDTSPNYLMPYID